MTHWLKRKFQQLSHKLNSDEDKTLNSLNPGDGNATPSGPENIEELKEIILGAIISRIRMLGYSNTTVAGLKFHSYFNEHAVENVSVSSLIKDPDFLKLLKRTFKSHGINYKDNFFLQLITQSPHIDSVTKITTGMGVEVLTPTDTVRKVKARVVATEGITWEPEYYLEPTGKNYFIGRCKDPKIDNGPKIHNDIAFIGIEEINEEQYKLNNYVSRSHANIIFDKETGVYKIYRSKFLNNPSHKIKIYNTSLNDFSGISLNQSTIPHVLKNGDSICFNDKVVLEFYLENQE